MCKDHFKRLESILSGEDRKCLDAIRNQFDRNKELWQADMIVLEEYYKDQEKENETLMIEISKRIGQIEKLIEQITKSTGKVEDSDKVEDNDKIARVLERNIDRLKRLIEKNEERLKRSYAAKFGWAKRNLDTELSITTKSYAAQLGWARKKHSNAVALLEKIYVESGNKRFKKIDSFRSKIQRLCSEAIDLCPTCNNPASFCKCKEGDKRTESAI